MSKTPSAMIPSGTPRLVNANKPRVVPHAKAPPPAKPAAAPSAVPAGDAVWTIDAAVATELGRLADRRARFAAEKSLLESQHAQLAQQLQQVTAQLQAAQQTAGILSAPAGTAVVTSPGEAHPVGTLFDPQTGLPVLRSAARKPAVATPLSRQVKRAVARKR